MEEESVMNEEKTPEKDALSSDEQEQFAAWLSKQDPNRRQHYLKLAQAYGFPSSDNAS